MAKRLVEIAGLGNALLDAQKAIAGVRPALQDMATSARRLKMAADDITTQCEDAFVDIKFQAEQLGNSAGSSETGEPSTTEQINQAAKVLLQPGDENAARRADISDVPGASAVIRNVSPRDAEDNRDGNR